MAAPDPRMRLVSLAEQRGASLAALSALIGRNASYLQQFVRKGSPRKLEEGDRRRLARFLGVDERELGGSEEAIFEPANDDWTPIPRRGLEASAGPGAIAGGEQAFAAMPVSRAWLRREGLDPALLSVIAVSGDSMEPTLRDGDEIVVDERVRTAGEGVYVVAAGDRLLVKRLDFSQPGLAVLVSDNPAHAPTKLALADIRIVGRVVWKSGRI
jgi:hypothetical protein